MEAINATVAATRNYLVLYSITRMEYYEITAVSPEEARQRAFCDGTLMETGETTDVTYCDIEDITPCAQRCHEGTCNKLSVTQDIPGGQSLQSKRHPA